MGSCQLLVKECAISTGELGGLPRNSGDRITERNVPEMT